MNQIFVLDANVFMEAARRYYPFDFAKPFWVFLKQQADSNTICSIDKVYDEIITGNDLLKDWTVDKFQSYFINTQTPQILRSYQKIVQYIQNEPQYNQRAKDVFMEASNADTWILAFAHASNSIIVTHEALDVNIKKRVPIPNVCKFFEIKYCDSFEMLRSLGFSF